MDTSTYSIRHAAPDDLDTLIEVGDELFDYAIRPEIAREFLADKRHHLLLAFAGNTLVGMASGLHYIHPDKEPEMFVNEVSVLPRHQNRGIGSRLVREMVEHGRSIGCKAAWIATETDNIAARKAYQSAGGVEDKQPFVLINFPDK